MTVRVRLTLRFFLFFQAAIAAMVVFAALFEVRAIGIADVLVILPTKCEGTWQVEVYDRDNPTAFATATGNSGLVAPNVIIEDLFFTSRDGILRHEMKTDLRRFRFKLKCGGNSSEILGEPTMLQQRVDEKRKVFYTCVLKGRAVE